MSTLEAIRNACKEQGFRYAPTVESILAYMVDNGYTLSTAIAKYLPTSYRWQSRIYWAAGERLHALIRAGVLEPCESVGGSESARLVNS